jgi:hypothetical protein
MMDNNTSTTSELKIIQTPSLEQIQTVVVWLENQQIENPNLELALNYLLQHKIIPHERGGLVAIAYTPSPNNSLDVNNIQGIMMAKPDNTSVLIEACNENIAQILHLREKPGFLRMAHGTNLNFWLRNPVFLVLLRMVQDVR